ncbi:gephyrin-like molybdotransferase receptor GlpR, partial [Nocardia brasiliensis]|uniref:gephyrin-like molybdotransferase receptor GlpR n=1 Tax=Nocardia brasiliensis TaxID=37326 RepID=UPI00313D0DF1
MPNSILWIGLVVLWVFVLFPILADRHPRIRRTTDAALATRVLHRGDSKRRTKSGPAAGHETDPNWRPRRTQRKYAHSDDAEDRMTTPADDPVTEGDPPAIAESAASHPEPERTDAELADAELAETELVDTELADDAERADADSDSADLPADDLESDTVAAEVDAPQDDAADDDDVHDDQAEQTRPEPAAARIPPARSTVPARVEHDDYDAARDDYDDDFDYVPTRRGRGGDDPEADAIARAARNTFRQRAVLGRGL